MWNLLGPVRRRLRRTGPRPLILMYHRVARPRVDPWNLAVDPDRFEQQLAVLRRTRHVLPMSEFAVRLIARDLPADAVAVTFDDGYADNLHVAMPRLQAAAVPALLFLMTGTVGTRAEYWWDELARLILLHRGATECEVLIAGQQRRFAVPEYGGTREAVYRDIWRRVRDIPASERARVMDQLRQRLDPPSADPDDFPMSEQEVVTCVASGVFEIGCHTVTHAVLPSVGAAERKNELVESRRACERLVNGRIEGFAYPHGEHDAASRVAVRECGFSWACSDNGPPLTPSIDPYAVSRVAVRNWDASAFERVMQEMSA
jgi:peptidoglycan/xylan/chitin deacetylase (PgdA/CDA1 family)